MPVPPTSDSEPTRHWPSACLAGVLLTMIFWSGLWLGDGLIGGDLYTYYLPQKQYLAEHLRGGEFPLWNSRVGQGYPLVGESQTAPFYPPHLLTYPWLEVNTAYNVVQLLHYVLAFLGMWLLARRLSLRGWGAGLAAVIYTYGWFPSRICLEWAIIGGAWLPWALWCAELYVTTRRSRFLLGLTSVLAVQMLAGHYHLAFITQLTTVAWLIGRLVWARLYRSVAVPDSEPQRDRLWRPLLWAGLAILAAFGLAAVQLAPSWELKQISQRADVGAQFDPGTGQIPLWYLTQVIAPWYWYDSSFDLNSALPAGASQTNWIEAHLYFSLAAIGLLLYGIWRRLYGQDRRLLLIGGLGLAALIYTTGWLVPITRHLPGFSYFAAPGRYGIVTTLAMGLLAGRAVDDLLSRIRPRPALLVGLAIFAVTIADLWLVSRWVTNCVILSQPPIQQLARSTVRRRLADFPQPVRLFCRGPNLPTLLGVASTPVYLGLGPTEYFDPKLELPQPYPFDEPPTAEQLDWLRRAGVTHVLSFTPLPSPEWPVRFVWTGLDRFLNPAWARREPFYLYELQGTRGRIAWDDPQPDASATITAYHANQVEARVRSRTGGLVVLTDLAYPGWQVTIDGKLAESQAVEGMYRGVQVPAGEHELQWTYAPGAIRLGGAVSVATLIMIGLLAAGAGMRRNRTSAGTL